MLALGRQSGLRLWLFAQGKTQIEQAYGDAERILDLMAVRCFIEPTGPLAHELSKETRHDTRSVLQRREAAGLTARTDGPRIQGQGHRAGGRSAPGQIASS